MKIAVIGAGIAGLSTAWLLARHAGGAHRVTLFEKSDRLGGHTNTIDVTLDGMTHPVDTGFLVSNDWTYPNLNALFAYLDIELAASDMSFGVKIMDERGRGKLEWCGSDNPATVFAQPANLLRPAFWGMLRDLLRFNKAATLLAARAGEVTGTLGEYLDANRYGAAFRDWYLKPMAACIWSTPRTKIDAFPLATFVSFCRNHGLLSINHRPQWRTVRGGARTYVEKMAAALDDVRLNARLSAAHGDDSGVTLTGEHGDEHFDHAVFACHSDQTARLLGNSQSEATQLLAGIPYQTNTAILHTDRRLLPDRERAWAAWNFMAWDAESAGAPVSLSYLINRLQPLPFKTPVIVTMNPLIAPARGKIIREMTYEHPVFLAESAATKRALRRLQGQCRLWFAGAWTRYGFHEDGLMSGIAVAKALGAVVPWKTDVPAANDLATRYPGVDA
jgi:uncharacterized protein